MTTPDPLRGNGYVVDSLGHALRSGEHGLSTVPGLLKRVLAEESWREFITQRGEHVRHDRFADFVATPPLKGLGASIELIDRIVGTDDPDLLRMLREAKKGKPGRPRKGEEKGSESESIKTGGTETADYQADRLAREARDEYEAVRRGEKTIHAAAVAAGIRKRRVSVRLDDPASAARTLRKHMTPEQLAALARLLLEDN